VICHERKCIFVHIPKTAGESVERIYLGKPLNRDGDAYKGTREKHFSIAEIKASDPIAFRDYFKFSIVRNPWDRFISFVLYRRRRRGFDDPLPAQIRRDLPHRWFHRKAASRMLYIDGSLAVDHVVRFERLADDMKAVWNALGMENIELPKGNVSPGRKPYWEYYDYYAMEFIRQAQRRDIELFDYRYEGPIPPETGVKIIWSGFKIRASCLINRL
jgi:hypothetical protein